MLILTGLILIAATPDPVEPHLFVGGELSLYRPGVDSAFSDASPYADLFGDGRRALLGGYVGLGVPLTPDLTVTLGAHVTHFWNSAEAFVDDGQGGQPSTGTTRSGGTTSLDATPISLRLGLRWTSLVRRLGVPLAAYGEFGPAYAPWSVGRGDGTSAASGATAGLVAGGGLMLDLAGLQARNKKLFRDEFGVESVFLKAGVTRLWLDGLGQSDALVLSDTAWTGGLELSF